MMNNHDKIGKFCNKLNLEIISLKLLKGKRYDLSGEPDYFYWELKVKLPFNYKEKFWSDLRDDIDDGVDVMFEHIEARIEHILNRNLTH